MQRIGLDALSNAESLGLRFRRVPITRYSTAGVPFQSGLSVGMPAVPEDMIRAVVYLYPSETAATEGSNFGGSGFLVGVQDGSGNHAYVVTNYHVAVKPAKGEPSPVVRVNRKDGKTDIFAFDVSDYHYLPGFGDVAVVRLPVESRVHDFKVYAFNNLVTKEQAEETLQLGEDVFMVGRFIDFDGGVTNRPALRFGNISMNPLPNDRTANFGSGVSYYCIDMHSRTGFSGAPVWAYRTMGSDLHDAIDGTPPQVHPPIAGILGLHCGQFPEALATDDGAPINGWSGMTVVLPAWRIAELLMSEKVVHERAAAAKAKGHQRRGPAEEGASAPVEHEQRFEEVVKKMLETPPAKPRGRGKKV